MNNAGAFDGGPIDELSVEAWDKVIALNLRAPFLCTRAAMDLAESEARVRAIFDTDNIGSRKREAGSQLFR